MKRLILLIILAIVIIGLLFSGLNDANLSLADTNVYAVETYSAPHDAGSSSACAANEE